MAILPPGNTLSTIETKVRRLTRSPSTAQLPAQDLDDYINTFIIYDFPEHLRTFNFRKTFTFYTNPYQDLYRTDELSFGVDNITPPTNAVNQPLYNFQNKYLTVHDPFYVAGFQSFFSQSREQFFNIYPNINSIASIGKTGDSATTFFSGVVINQGQILNPGQTTKAAFLQNQVLFSSVDSAFRGLAMVDVPVLDSVSGLPSIIGNLYPQDAVPIIPPVGTAQILPFNNFNYVTGAFNVTFTTAPGIGQAINSQTVPLQATLPQAVLYYNNAFIVRPIPDQPYRVNFEVYARPTAILQETGVDGKPALEEYWQLIAYGAAKKIFEDRMDMDSVALIMPEYTKQMQLVMRRTIVQQTNERTATIYSEQSQFGPGFGGWGWGSF